MYFGTVNGLVSFTPDLTKKDSKPYKVHFTDLLINGKEATARTSFSPPATTLYSKDVLDLDFDRSRQFGIGYGVIDPERAGSTFYQVKVDGIDRDWRDVGKLRRFTALELAPGTYRLNVRASSNPEEWDAAPVSTLAIKIAPPFYRSVWAYLIYLLIIGFIAYFCYRLFNIRMREKQSVRLAQIDKDKSEELNREKMEFFTNISHELKTPLSLILAPLKYLDQHQALGARCYIIAGFSSGNVYRFPWPVWKDMKKYFGRKYISESDARIISYLVPAMQDGFLLLLD